MRVTLLEAQISRALRLLQVVFFLVEIGQNAGFSDFNPYLEPSFRKNFFPTMRVAVGIHGHDIDRVLETYEALSTGMFIHATPTLFNAGTPRPQMSSCFLIANKEDSIDGIYEHF